MPARTCISMELELLYGIQKYGTTAVQVCCRLIAG